MIRSGDIPYVAFITDFGLNDSYVCELHAVLFSICPQARVFDVTHGIAPGDGLYTGKNVRTGAVGNNIRRSG